MQQVNIVLMGKSGVGKSTIVNAVIGEYKAEEGRNKRTTTCQKKYCINKRIKTHVGDVEFGINIVDTMGLEIDEAITEKTLKDIKKCLQEVENRHSEDINIIWFCINQESDRIEPEELRLLDQITFEYEIPFIILLTKCKSTGEELLAEINKLVPEIKKIRVIAKEYKISGGYTISAFGIDEALEFTVVEYDEYKIQLLTNKLKRVENDLQRVENLKKQGKKLIEYYSKKANKAANFSVLGLPRIFSLCKHLIKDINHTIGIDDSKLAEEIFSDYVVGVILSPLMAVPFLGKLMAESYIESVGDGYLDLLIGIVEKNSYDKNVKERIVSEIRRRKNG